MSVLLTCTVCGMRLGAEADCGHIGGVVHVEVPPISQKFLPPELERALPARYDAPHANAPAITPDVALSMLRGFNRRYFEHDDKPVTDAQVEAMALALNDVLGIPIDDDAFEAAGWER